jgi:hypothetical protein
LLSCVDIDHALIENNGVNEEIYAYAFKLLTGPHANIRAVCKDGQLVRGKL